MFVTGIIYAVADLIGTALLKTLRPSTSSVESMLISLPFPALEALIQQTIEATEVTDVTPLYVLAVFAIMGVIGGYCGILFGRDLRARMLARNNVSR